MQYAASRGIPHSEFLKWSEQDQDKAIAWMLADMSRCQSCGTVPSEWLDDEGYDREPPPYVATTQICLGCETLQTARSEVPDDAREIVHVYLKPYEDGEGNGGKRDTVRQDRTPS